MNLTKQKAQIILYLQAYARSVSQAHLMFTELLHPPNKILYSKKNSS